MVYIEHYFYKVPGGQNPDIAKYTNTILFYSVTPKIILLKIYTSLKCGPITA